MRRLIALLLTIFLLPQTALAQDDDRGFLTRTLEGALSGAGREVRIDGFAGALSSEASFERMTIADAQGVWLTLEDVTLNWSRAALLRGRLEVTELTAELLDVPRLPVAEEAGVDLPPAEAQGFSLPDLPVSINIDQIGIADIRLGAPLLGDAMTLSLDASARLDETGLDARIDAARSDGQEGQFDLTVAFGRADSVLNVDMSLREAPGGLVGRLLNLPGQPSVALSVVGEGPLDQYVADIDLTTDDVQRVTGRVATSIQSDDPQSDRQITVDVSGDIAPLVAPQYADFFGPNVALQADATLQADGMIALEQFAMRARALDIAGRALLNQDRWPVLLDVSGRMVSPDGTPTVLPGGGGASVAAANLVVDYDAARGDAFMARVEMEDFVQDGVGIETAALEMDGTLQGNLGSVGQFLVDLTLDAAGVDFADAELGQAVGRDLRARTQINYIEGQPVRLSNLTVAGAGLDARGWIIIGAPGDGLPTRLSLAVATEQLSRFGGLLEQPLAGAAEVNVEGRVAPLAGTFDLGVRGRTTDLSIGVEQADALLKGDTRLSLVAQRDATGTFVKDLVLENAAVSARADATLKTGQSTVDASVSLADLAPLLPGFPGAARLQIAAREGPRGLTVDATLDAPEGAKIIVSGLATGPEAALDFNANLPNLAVFVPQIPGPLSAEGRAMRAPDGWRIQTNATGPGGTSAVVAGLIGTEGVLNIIATGAVPLGLSRPFIAPRSLQGQARFDLRVVGPPALSSVSGEITTNGATLSAPNLRVALQGLDTRINLNGGRADINATAQVVSGGQVSVGGALSLNGTPSADLQVRLADVVVVDPRLFRTRVSGAINVTGPLSSGTRLSGSVNVAETEVTVPASGLTTIGEIPAIRHVGSSRAARATRARAGVDAVQTSQTQSGGSGGLLLDIQVNAPNRMFVRGRGIDAELGGALRLTGTTQQVISAGRFELIRGRLDILGKRFDLIEGSTQFQGSLTPYIRFVTQTNTSTGTAGVIVDGPADAPEVQFVADPIVPQDEVLAQLLFGRDISQISAFQALQLANAVATLAGGGGAGIISGLRDGFGLDDLDITTTDEGQTAVRVGKYLSENVYTDVTAASDGSAEVSLNLDISPSLTAKGTAGTDGNTGVGLFFERDY